MFRRVTILAILAGIVLLIAGDLFASTDRAIALTLKVSGEVNLRKAGKSDVGPLKFGTPLDDGDWIRTENDGYAVLIFADDKSQIKLKADTEVVINGKRDAESSISKRITMEIGEVFAKVDKQRGSLEVATPTSVASVKGTEFWVLVQEDGTTVILTLEGLVELMNRISGAIVNVSVGEQGTSDPQGGNEVTPAPPENIPQDPDAGGDGANTIEIEVKDPDGRKRTVIIQYIEGAE